MIDSLREHEGKAESSPVLPAYQLEKGGYALLTLHRAANVDDRECFIEILEGMRELAIHIGSSFPRTPERKNKFASWGWSRISPKRTDAGSDD